MSTAKRTADRILRTAATVEPGATECPDCGGELEGGFRMAADLLCGTCYRAWSYPASPRSARKIARRTIERA